ncbi:FHA domain-containing protein [Besnoitia besnoiti]|uniref:FHA domain-containing protein n=1 Tax=Besnoitia besnoiti TaxID=94643 RepID=A0A2A9MM40_BESBE|nr:FHA domain-containing protein [Besnoitia besnoiti]PFH36590.1 FHA domain-containing protein [Besnoitia besnoiti]
MEGQSAPSALGGSGGGRSGSRNRGCLMSVSCLTWASDSHGLFDYESRNVFKKNFKIQCLREAYRAIRVKTDVLFLPEEEAVHFLQHQQEFPPSDVRSLLKIQWTNGAYHVIPSHASEVCIDPSSPPGPGHRAGGGAHARALASSAAPSHSSHTLLGRNPSSPCLQPAVLPASSPLAAPSTHDEGHGVSSAASLSASSPPSARRSAGAESDGAQPATPRTAGAGAAGGQSLFPPENMLHASRGRTAWGPSGPLRPPQTASRVVSPNPSSSSLAPGAGTSEGAPASSVGSARLVGTVDRASSRASSDDAPSQVSSPLPGAGVSEGASATGRRGPSEAAAPDGVEGTACLQRNRIARTEPGSETAGGGQAADAASSAGVPPASVAAALSSAPPADDDGESHVSGYFHRSGSSPHLPPGGFADGSVGVGGGAEATRICSEKIWLVVRSLRERGGVTLREGDVMKLGRFRLKVKELVANFQQAARAQEHRLPAADADECETVAPEPESQTVAQTAMHVNLNNQPYLSLLGDGGTAVALSRSALGEGLRVASPQSLPQGAADPAGASGGGAGEGSRAEGEGRGDRDAAQGEGRALAAAEAEPHDAAFLAPQSQAGAMPVTAAATDDEDAGGTNLSPNARRDDRGARASDAGELSSNPPAQTPSQCARAAPPPAALFAASRSGSYGAYLQRPACRICLCEAADEDEPDSRNNPLVAPCRCKGSMQHVHLQCLRTWMEGRLNIRSDGTTVGYFLRALDCELCKAPYPAFVDGGRGRVIELFEIPRPAYPYIILEPRSSHPAPSAPSPPVPRRGLHVVSLASRRIARLGRGHESDIRLSDISVSRLHALIKFSQGAFWLEDQRSKFGTLVELRRPLKLERGSTGVALQVGRTVISIVVKRQWSLPLPACLKGVRAPESDIMVVECPQQPPAAPPTASALAAPSATPVAFSSADSHAGAGGAAGTVLSSSVPRAGGGAAEDASEGVLAVAAGPGSSHDAPTQSARNASPVRPETPPRPTTEVAAGRNHHVVAPLPLAMQAAAALQGPPPTSQALSQQSPWQAREGAASEQTSSGASAPRAGPQPQPQGTGAPADAPATAVAEPSGATPAAGAPAVAGGSTESREGLTGSFSVSARNEEAGQPEESQSGGGVSADGETGQRREHVEGNSGNSPSPEGVKRGDAGAV